MKKSRFLKKAAAVAAAAALALCACFGGALADEEETVTVPSDTDSAAVTVYNVEEGATVTAYQIVDAEYDAYGLTGYSAVDGVSIEDLENITSEELAVIAQDIRSGSVTLSSVSLTDSTDDSGNYIYTGSLAAGSWIVLVTGTSGTYIYSPMLVSAYYTDADDASTLTGVGVSNDGEKLKTENSSDITLYAKYAEVGITKYIVETADDGTVSYASSTTADAGDTVSYQISTTIPAYDSSDYSSTTMVFTITDTWADGLNDLEASDVTVTVDGTAVNASEDSTYTLSVDTASNTLTITFDSAYILEHAGADVVVSYSQTVNSNAVVDTDEDPDEGKNTASLTYTSGASADETETQATGSVTADPCYVYTFEIDGEIIKVDADNTSTLLSGATFTLYTYTTSEDAEETAITADTLASSGTSVATAVSADNTGLIVFEGLDAGTYYLVETDAPDGYALNDDVYQIVISAEIGQDGVIDSYTVTVTNLSSYDSDEDSETYGTYTESLTNTYTCTESTSTSEDGTETTTYSWTINGDSGTVSALKILNTSLTSLPSTGGMGTMVFTAVGIILIAAAVCVFVVYFRKQKRNSSGE